jgi:DNA end-binding protein Ku
MDQEVEAPPPSGHEEASPPSSPRVEPDPVAYEDVVKGYEVEDGRYVLVTPEELRALEPERSQTIDIEEFVDLARVDPVYFERSYWALPDRGSGADKPYALLVRAMAATGKAGVGRFVFRTREHLAALRVTGDVLALHTMFFADEVRDPVELGVPVGAAEASDREAALAEQLISMLEREWDPARHTDAYRERVMDLIEKKAGGPVVSREPDVAEPSAVPDLMAALRASVEAAKKQRQAG